jgi:hypothetical protein
LTQYYNGTKYTTRNVISANVYYIKVWAYLSEESGTYKIGFNTTTTAPSS